MFVNHKFLIGETDRFDSTDFPQLDTCLEQIVVQLNREQAAPKADMLLSFVKDHCINSQQVIDHPKVASLISTKSLPLGMLEDLFEAGRSNPLFKKGLETHIRSYFLAAHLS